MNFLLCDGTLYLKTDYPALAAVLGTTFGGDSTHFGVPNMKGRFPMGAGLASGPRGATAHALGSAGGEETHGLLAAESGVNGNGNPGTGDESVRHAHTGTTDGESGHTHTLVDGVSNGVWANNGSGSVGGGAGVGGIPVVPAKTPVALTPHTRTRSRPPTTPQATRTTSWPGTPTRITNNLPSFTTVGYIIRARWESYARTDMDTAGLHAGSRMARPPESGDARRMDAANLNLDESTLAAYASNVGSSILSFLAAQGVPNPRSVTAYGAIGDGSTDNLRPRSPARSPRPPRASRPRPLGVLSGTVFFPAGTFVTGPLVLPERVALVGVPAGAPS